MTDKNINKVAENIKKQITAIQHHTVKNEVVKLNSIILGVHNYYSMATMCNIDFHRVYFLVKPTMDRLKKTLSFKQEICNYTKEGRNLIHSNLNDGLQVLIEYLLENRDEHETVKFNDNRISKLAGQNGKSFISGMKLEKGNMVCCRKLPKNKGGTDDYENLVWITIKEQELITKVEISEKDLVGVELDDKAKKKLNSLRLLVENLPI